MRNVAEGYVPAVIPPMLTGLIVFLSCGGRSPTARPPPDPLSISSLRGTWVLSSTTNPAPSATAAVGGRLKDFTDLTWETGLDNPWNEVWRRTN